MKIIDVKAYPLAAPRPGMGPDKPDRYLAKNAPADVAKEVRKLVEAGHDQVKVKIGMGKMGATKDADLEVIKAVRGEVGADVDVMVDANSAYNLDEAIELGGP